MKNILKTACVFALAMLFVGSSVSPTNACPKKHRLIKFVGRSVKSGVVGCGHTVASGFRFVRDKVKDDLS